ncbi:unnamed protein product, partial [Owenia fusiformis]
ECCCQMFEATFVGKCCHKDTFDYCYDCPDDSGNKRAILHNKQPCWMRFSTEMNIVNNKNQLTSLSSIYCAINKCRVCSPIDVWPFSKCWGTKPDIVQRGRERLAAITRRTAVCCKMRNCTGSCRQIDISPYCQCYTDTKGSTSQCNVNIETCFAKVAPPMMVLSKDSATDQCEEPVFAYEICCAMRDCKRNGGDKKECCVSSGLVSKSCYCC